MRVAVLCALTCASAFLHSRSSSPSAMLRAVDIDAELSPYETSGRPRWAGGGPVSDLANALIASPLFKYVKAGARNLIIKGSAKAGVDWEANRAALQAQQSSLDECFLAVNDASMQYPWYYTQVRSVIPMPLCAPNS